MTPAAAIGIYSKRLDLGVLKDGFRSQKADDEDEVSWSSGPSAIDKLVTMGKEAAAFLRAAERYAARVGQSWQQEGTLPGNVRNVLDVKCRVFLNDAPKQACERLNVRDGLSCSTDYCVLLAWLAVRVFDTCHTGTLSTDQYKQRMRHLEPYILKEAWVGPDAMDIAKRYLHQRQPMPDVVGEWLLQDRTPLAPRMPSPKSTPFAQRNAQAKTKAVAKSDIIKRSVSLPGSYNMAFVG